MNSRIKLTETAEPNEALDNLVREFCAENDVGKMKGCPKCGFKSDDPLSLFCTWSYCPVREWREAKKAKSKKAK